MSLTDALRSLSEAHGPKALMTAFNALQGTVRRSRRAAKKEIGTLAQTFYAAMEIWDRQKADGVSTADRLAGLEKTLRASWPQTREWKYLCGDCGDIGLIISQCDGGSACGRYKAHLPHSYGSPCWCKAGETYRAQPKPAPEDFKAAGRSKPMTRMGR